MKQTYEDVLEYRVYDAIAMLKKDISIEDLISGNYDNPAKIKKNPLLLDFDYVYENAENILCNNMLNYQQNQSFEAYLILFKALTKKYNFEEDYDRYLTGNDCTKSQVELKWSMFFYKLFEFMNHAFDERLEKLLNQKEVIDYLLKYQVFLNGELLSECFGHKGMGILLKHNHIKSKYIDKYDDLIQLIRKNPFIQIPVDIMLNEKIIKDMSHDYHLEEFYFNLAFIEEQICTLTYLEEHIKYCDNQILNIKDGILPCYYEKYISSNEKISIRDIYHFFTHNEMLVANRIFERSGKNILPKKYFYQELSKYMIVGMFISRNYQTDPYNLYIDLETLYKHSTKNNKQLQALSIYEVLINFEDRDINELVNIYNQGKELPLMELLYDDWNNMKYEFIDTLNETSYKVDSQPNQSELNYIDITDIEEPIIVHNTGIPIERNDKINKLIDAIKNGEMSTISLSLQDKKHNEFYIKDGNGNKTTIKFAYGPLKKERVGIIRHEDAYSTGADSVESENFTYKRMHYTVEEFMNMTNRYNEIVYVIGGEPFMPIGLICEDEISDEEKYVADSLGIPILYRNKKNIESNNHYIEEQVKHYVYTIDKPMFK